MNRLNKFFMQKNKRIIISVVIAVAILAVSALVLSNKPTSQAATIQSEDGRVSLNLPEGALPKGVDASDIKITPISLEEFHGGDSINESLVVFSLEPDGLQLEKPVTVTYETDLLEEQNIPIMFHVSESGSEILDNIDVKFDSEQNKMSVSANINHFSELVYDLEGLFFRKFEGPEENEVDVPFPWKFTLTPLTRAEHLNPKDYRGPKPFKSYGSFFYSLAKDTKWTFNSGGKSDINWDANYIKPEKADLPEKELDYGQPYIVEGAFTCIAESESDRKFGVNFGKIKIDYTIAVEEVSGYTSEKGYEHSGNKKEIKTSLNLWTAWFAYTCIPTKESRPKMTAPEFEPKFKLEGGIFGSVDLN